ncbi:MAG: tRNA-queuosine alpha-mannosyltransferase domain-containing protein [Pseudohaliea sp.]
MLLLSAYAADSHEYWRRSVAALLPDHRFTVLTLPPRHFSWRLRGNALYWASTERAVLEAGYEAVVATSLVDLATLRGLVPALGSVPTLLYFHENQFAYPPAERQQGRVEAQITGLYSALAADRLAFNSRWNRDSFLRGVAELLARLPDRVPPGIVDNLAARSEVLPVPLAADVGAPGEGPVPGAHPFSGDGPYRGPAGRPLRVAWLGRFEYDKGPERLHALARSLAGGPRPVELALVGRRFRREPEAFAALPALLGERLVHRGYLPARAEYLALLSAADIALSTARHEFQGIAVLEAVARGCLPCVPDGLSYPELYPARFRYPVGETAEEEGRRAAALIDTQAEGLAAGMLEAPSVAPWEGPALAPRYAGVLDSIGR